MISEYILFSIWKIYVKHIFTKYSNHNKLYLHILLGTINNHFKTYPFPTLTSFQYLKHKHRLQSKANI
jgi:hypothetical protein